MKSVLKKWGVCGPILTGAVVVALGLGAVDVRTAFGEGAEPRTPEKQSEAAEGVKPEVDESIELQKTEQREKLIEDATIAMEKTIEALEALEDDEKDKALDALSIATGKLELVVARDPSLALAPVDVSVTTYDLYAQPETIEAVLDETKELLDDGRVQAARGLLSTLASETVIETANVPLAAYPAAIKAVTPMIDAGKIAEAKAALRAALDTIVISRVIVPLPVTRARLLLADAEELAEKKERSETENQELADALAGSREQLRIAELLGYGEAAWFAPMYEQIDQIEAKTEGGKSGEGFFDRIKKDLSRLLA